ncbi:Peptidase family M23 [Mucilaginibacter pineti]|uniref:Peptidase family M23 n=1 Tax=Mucilaginibacter pineti TaxID=1391627 RepID=A0A1G6WEY8_9SPHI|nr:M23 family metallopeptidase [Mucilaginibacter pineti]SDD64510.1 Peptidase family M23 [Mucilaginibacter pineti]
MIKKYIITLCALYLGFYANAQQSPIIQSKQYPQNYFRYPLDLPPTTAGSFGELRPAHFHSGLDFKTNQRTGYPVHAAADGYVSRVRVQFGGFGRAVYITHPNGYTTVYGHLQSFSAAIAALVKAYQYDHQTYEADFKLEATQVKVCKDEVFAISGNAGASAGPHVHFEIRDSQTEETINAQLFGLTIPDKVPPSITSIGIYHLNGNPFSEKTPKEFLGVTGAAGSYHLTKPQVLHLSGNIGFGINTTDMNSTSANHNGIYSLELKLDGQTVYTFAVERFAFDQTHAINAYIDYPAFTSSRRWMQKCFIMPGSHISLYPQSINRGIITFNDNALHDVEYVVKDVAGNTSSLKLKIQSSAFNAPITKIAGTLFHYDEKSEFSTDKVKVSVSPGNLYDDLDFIYSVSAKPVNGYSQVHHIHNALTPIHDSYSLWIKPDVDLGKYADKAVIVSTAGFCQGGYYQDGYVKGQPASFGDFYIKIDTVPPVITPLNIKNGSHMAAARSINFRMSDNLSGIKSYVGTIDNKWVLMEHDYKSKILSYTFSGDIGPGKHVFKLTIGDNKNNFADFTAEFYR